MTKFYKCLGLTLVTFPDLLLWRFESFGNWRQHFIVRLAWPFSVLTHIQARLTASVPAAHALTCLTAWSATFVGSKGGPELLCNHSPVGSGLWRGDAWCGQNVRKLPWQSHSSAADWRAVNHDSRDARVHQKHLKFQSHLLYCLLLNIPIHS